MSAPTPSRVTRDEQLTMEMAAAIAAHPGIELGMGAQETLCVIAALQLALRHPAYEHGPSRPIVEGVARALGERLATEGPLATVIEMGWNPAHDETEAQYADPAHREAVAEQVRQAVADAEVLAELKKRETERTYSQQRSEQAPHTRSAYGNLPEPGFRIGAITAFVSIDPEDDAEGVCGVKTPVGWMPMIAANEDRIRSLRQVAKEIAQETQRPVNLVRFSKREDVETIEP